MSFLWEVNMDYVTKEQYRKDIEKLRIDIDNLKERKADREVLQGIKQDIAVLTEQINNMQADRKEDKETISELKDEIKNISKLINDSALTSVEIKGNQKRSEEKLTDLKTDMGDMKANINSLSSSVEEIKSSINNTLPKNFIKKFQNDKYFKLIAIICMVFLILGILSTCSFFIQNGIPWDKLKTFFDIVRY